MRLCVPVLWPVLLLTYASTGYFESDKFSARCVHMCYQRSGGSALTLEELFIHKTLYNF